MDTDVDESMPYFIDKGGFKVFLSYSSDDEKQFERYVDELKTCLESHKIKAITAPHDQAGGDDGNEYIASKIQTCDVLLALHTETCKSSDYLVLLTYRGYGKLTNLAINSKDDNSCVRI